MTKQEAIQAAYGFFWKEIEDIVDENGCISFKPKGIKRISKVDNNLYRPNSLKGIENNNGWIKIDSEEDLPKENINCYFLDKKGGLL